MVRGTARIASAAFFAGLVCLVSLAGCARKPAASPEELFRRGLYLEKENKFWEAIVDYRWALEADPANVEIRLRLADLLTQTDDTDSAERNYRIVLTYDPQNATAINNLAWLCALRGGDLDWALTAMKPLAAKDSPHRHTYLDTLGMVYFKRREYPDAVQAFEEAAALCRKGVVMSTSEECDQINEHLRAAKRR